MSKSNRVEPLVSIITPVYNGEKYVAECIESVLEQTYENWEYIILNNRSTDNTLQIAETYAEKDRRIKVYTNEEFLKQIPNWNESLRKISDKSKYCKVVHADDILLAECIEKMVARAQEYPSAGIISSYRFVGSSVRGVRGNGLSYKTTFLSGREAGRKVITTPLFLFGSPSTVLYRADLVREYDPFYDPAVVHADTDACFNMLQQCDFAFVHQILSYTRLHEEATSNFCDYFHTYSLFDIYTIKNYGHYYLSPDEYDKLLGKAIVKHHHWVTRLMLNGRGHEVWQYHKEELDAMGLEINKYEMLKSFVLEIVKIKPVIKWGLNRFRFLSPAQKKQQAQKNTIENKKKSIVLTET